SRRRRASLGARAGVMTDTANASPPDWISLRSRRWSPAADVAAILPADGYDPWNFFGEPCPKPMVIAAHRRCNTLGIELMLASEVPSLRPEPSSDSWRWRAASFLWGERRSGSP